MPRSAAFSAALDSVCPVPRPCAVLHDSIVMKRTHHCAQLSLSDLNASVSLIGWVDTIRDQGGIIFIDLRDRKGVTQIKLEAHDNAQLAEQLKHLKPESVIEI